MLSFSNFFMSVLQPSPLFHSYAHVKESFQKDEPAFPAFCLSVFSRWTMRFVVWLTSFKGKGRVGALKSFEGAATPSSNSMNAVSRLAGRYSTSFRHILRSLHFAASLCLQLRAWQVNATLLYIYIFTILGT